MLVQLGPNFKDVSFINQKYLLSLIMNLNNFIRNLINNDDEDEYNFVNNYLGRANYVRRPFSERRNHFFYWNEKEFYIRFRLSKQSVQFVLNQIEGFIQSPTNWNHALTPMEMLLLTLRFYATGSMLIVAGDYCNVHKTTAGKVIFKVTEALARLRPLYIKFPSTQEEKYGVQRGFFDIARFPRVLGAIDCTHVKIRSPGGNNAEIFRNRKNFYSINVQTISDSNLKILDVVARWHGSAHDSTIFNNSQICTRFENGEMGNGVLVADSGYAVKHYLMTPLLNPATIAENLYNEAQIRTRNPVERSYGVWKRRFPILSNGISLELHKVQWIIVATAVLHNIACDNNEVEPPILHAEDERAFQLALHIPNQNNIYGQQNNIVRNNLIRYFENL